MTLEIVNREDWGAKVPLAHNVLEHPVNYVVCMATNGYPCYNNSVCKFTLRYVQSFHMKRKKMKDIRFNFMIVGNGKIYEGRGWHHAPLLPQQFLNINSQSILIGFVGQYDEETLPEEMLTAREELVKYGIENNYIDKDCKRWEIFKRKEGIDQPEQIVQTTK
ncbi:peptidoglycan-recognition protein SC2-like [Macrosteles quadrilineatus]|uniref:peptidoglycan-recognition protein SC2-like n=1 Tax=Macrosteles quadrilineatus TaxID=74068 RepID=UPI0023E19ABB|nr:peptidoglycan-recognition protein SC2-like [Macrosteles quadrilineatus]XP_054263662.1 peptidoglycan-recognition protein SC2-like [Macrosteles quadrilineatus]